MCHRKLFLYTPKGKLVFWFTDVTTNIIMVQLVMSGTGKYLLTYSFTQWCRISLENW